MPVTARLSKAFYERFGEKIANELVDWFNAVDTAYRNDLRNLNEQNFARFDSKLEQRLVELEARLDKGFRDELTKLRTKDLTDIRIELREREGRLLRWMSAYWVSTIGIMITLLRLWG